MTNEPTILDWNWEITRRCNLQCLHCIIGDNTQYELTTKESLDAIFSIVRLGGKTLRITGGEPLVRNDLIMVLKEASSLGLRLELITNGTLLNTFLLGSVCDYISRIAISIDGNQKLHNHIRGAGTYQKSITAIKNIIDCGIELSVFITINSINENCIAALIEELIALGVSSFHINEINMDGRAIYNKYLTPNMMEPRKRADVIFSQLQSIIDVGVVSFNSSCSITPNSVYMNSSGVIYPCSELAFRLPSKNIANILEGEVREKFHRFYLDKLDKTEEQCPYSVFSIPGISIFLNEPKECPHIRRNSHE